MNPPPPEPDELGYSLLCRHADRWGHAEDYGLWQSWTGPESGHRQLVEVVAGCRRLARVAYPALKDAERHFVRNHTLLPYFTAFMSRERRTASFQEIRGESPSVSRSLHGTVRQSTGLRFCADCATEQLRRHGFSYWTRTAQLPALSCCPRHGTSLKQTHVLPDVNSSQNRLQSLDQSVRGRTDSCSPRLMNRRLEARIALRSAWALRSGLGRGEPVSVDHYRRALFQAGYGNRRGELRISSFQEDFGRWLGQAGARADDFGSNAWWLRLVTRIGGSTSPLQHMLLQEFICESARKQAFRQPDLFESPGSACSPAAALQFDGGVCGDGQMAPTARSGAGQRAQRSRRPSPQGDNDTIHSE